MVLEIVLSPFAGKRGPSGVLESERFVTPPPWSLGPMEIKQGVRRERRPFSTMMTALSHPEGTCILIDPKPTC